jgi:hypothetical protein
MGNNVNKNLDDRFTQSLFVNSHFCLIALIGGEHLSKSDRGKLLTYTCMHILSYFPLVSTISGIARIIFAKKNGAIEEMKSPSLKKAFKEGQIIRGVVDCLSIAGPLLFVIDIAFTALLAYKANQFEKSQSPG